MATRTNGSPSGNHAKDARPKSIVDVRVSFEGTPYVTRDTAALSPREFRQLTQRVMAELKSKSEQ